MQLWNSRKFYYNDRTQYMLSVLLEKNIRYKNKFSVKIMIKLFKKFQKTFYFSVYIVCSLYNLKAIK